jgi:hypothetical protein
MDKWIAAGWLSVELMRVMLAVGITLIDKWEAWEARRHG